MQGICFCALNSRKHACSMYCIVKWELNEAALWDEGIGTAHGVRVTKHAW